MTDDLITPGWYPGDEVWLLLNKLWVPAFALLTIVGFIVLYKIIKGDWEKHIVFPFILNIIGVVLVPIVLFKLQSLTGGLLITLLFLASTIAQMYVLREKSLVLAGLCLPYAIWTLPFIVFYIEIIRLN